MKSNKRMNKRRAHEYAMKQAKKQIARILYKVYPNEKLTYILRYESWRTPYGPTKYSPLHKYELVVMGTNDLYDKMEGATLDKVIAELQLKNNCWL